VSVSISAGRFGSVLVKAEGQTHEFSATASTDIPSGTPVTVTATAGTGLVVAPLAPPQAPAPPAEPGQAQSNSGAEPANTTGSAGSGGTTGA
jgi:hypothetical protein